MITSRNTHLYFSLLISFEFKSQEEDNFKAERSKEREEYLAEKEERCNKKEIEDPIERRKDYFQETSKYTPESKLELQVNQKIH